MILWKQPNSKSTSLLFLYIFFLKITSSIYIFSVFQALAEAFLDHLWKVLQSPSQPAVLRQAAAGYLGSFLARAKFIPVLWVHSAEKSIKAAEIQSEPCLPLSPRFILLRLCPLPLLQHCAGLPGPAALLDPSLHWQPGQQRQTGLLWHQPARALLRCLPGCLLHTNLQTQSHAGGQHEER